MKRRIELLEKKRKSLARLEKKAAPTRVKQAKLDFIGMCGRFIWEIKQVVPTSTVRGKYTQKIQNMLDETVYQYCLGN